MKLLHLVLSWLRTSAGRKTWGAILLVLAGGAGVAWYNGGSACSDCFWSYVDLPDENGYEVTHYLNLGHVSYMVVEQRPAPSQRSATVVLSNGHRVVLGPYLGMIRNLESALLDCECGAEVIHENLSTPVDSVAPVASGTPDVGE